MSHRRAFAPPSIAQAAVAIALLTIGAAAAAAGPAAAQTQTPQELQLPAQQQQHQQAASWMVPCDGQAGALDCRVMKTLFLRDTRQLVMAVSVRRPDGNADPAMLVHLPHGLFLPAGATLHVDEGKPERYQIQTCDQRGCYVGLPVPDALLQVLKNGQKLTVQVQDTKKRPIAMSIGLQGFAEAYAKLP